MRQTHHATDVFLRISHVLCMSNTYSHFAHKYTAITDTMEKSPSHRLFARSSLLLCRYDAESVASDSMCVYVMRVCQRVSSVRA